MAAPINNSPGSVPEKAILDLFGRQTYLGNAFNVSTQANPIGSTSETALALFQNPASNTKSMFVFVRRFQLIANAANVNCVFRTYQNPTITSLGTPVTPVNMRTNPNLPPSTIRVFSGTTVSSNGTFLSEVTTTSTANPFDSNILSIVDPGGLFYLTALASNLNANVGFQIVWFEI